ncbi:MAG TPA: ExeM/NucH family extracellular endonuclease [Trueperaceae bacterium]
MTKSLGRLVLTAMALVVVACAGPAAGPAAVGRQAVATRTARAAAPADTQAVCGAPAEKIHVVQGSGPASDLAGEIVTIEGVVVGDFQPGDGDDLNSDLGGFYVQEEDSDADGDPSTSEGIYVWERRADVEVGQLVRLTGRVSETDGLTLIRSVRDLVVCAENEVLPTPVQLTLPVDELSRLESHEGMLVEFSQELVISEYFNFDRFGEVVLTAPGPGTPRVYQPTSYLDPGDPAIRGAMDLVIRSRITLDDGREAENPVPARHPAGGAFTRERVFRGGDVLEGVTGVLSYGFGTYRVQPTQGARLVNRNPRPERPPDVGGTVRAGVFNVLNYFEDFGPVGCGPEGRDDCRGADDQREFQRQRAKIIAAIAALDAQVVGLIEIENDADQGALRDLVDGLNDASAPGTYDFVDGGGPVGIDAIRVAIVYQPAVLRPVGAPAVLDDMAFLDPNDTGEDRNRAALAQTFQDVAGGATFTFVVNHLKSKGESCGRGDDDPVQGNCNVTRTLAARLLLDWLDSDPTGSGDEDFLVVGDLNSYDHEDPIRALAAGHDGQQGTDDDWVDLLRRFEGEEAYTYVFDGQLGYLDYAFASPTLAAQVTGAGAWHINADEPDILDYDLTFKRGSQAELYEPSPYRSSDHDPVLVGLTLDAAGAR